VLNYVYIATRNVKVCTDACTPTLQVEEQRQLRRKAEDAKPPAYIA